MESGVNIGKQARVVVTFKDGTNKELTFRYDCPDRIVEIAQERILDEHGAVLDEKCFDIRDAGVW